MKILVYGAGVIGCTYAVRFYQYGFDVTLLARGKRYEDLLQNGITIKNILTGTQSSSRIALTPQLEPTDFYDLIIVTVRLDQLNTVIPVLKQNTESPLILFMLNNPDNIGQMVNELRQKHIVLGFPGVGGICRNNTIDYIQIKQQETTIGEVNGERSNNARDIKSVFEKAGFRVKISSAMIAWLKTHAVFVACVSAAIIKENGDSIALGKKKSSVKIMVQSIREGFAACKKLGMPIKPTNLQVIFMITPLWFSVMYWQRAMQGKIGTLSIAPHASAAKEEMQLLAKKVLNIVHSSNLPSPTLDKLLSTFINSI